MADICLSLGRSFVYVDILFFDETNDTRHAPAALSRAREKQYLLCGRFTTGTRRDVLIFKDHKDLIAFLNLILKPTICSSIAFGAFFVSSTSYSKKMCLGRWLIKCTMQWKRCDGFVLLFGR